MNSISAWLKTLWDVLNEWDVRVMVLISLTLQVVLFVFGKCRKYISSVWVSVVVWLAYLVADWVATVALGKLSDAQVNHHSKIANPSNALQAIWAPLLLLHLGGPDTITAYSLEDNQLWMRHFLGMGVQAAVAIYVIVMSWRDFWFSFLLIPAFVAGIIKYGERTWALQLACHDKLGDMIPFHDLHGESFAGSTTIGKKYANALTIAYKLVKAFKAYMENYDIGRFGFQLESEKMNLHDWIFWDALEVEIGLMYDLLYTKAPVIYTKKGCIFRSISFICTMSVLVGLFWLLFTEKKWHEQHYSMVDIAITGVLLVGALALEIYAIILLLSSDWAMLWLIKCNRGKCVIQLGRKFPWFFQKGKWSKVMGQFDLLKFCEKEDKHAKFSRVLKWLRIEDKFNRYMHKTCVAVPSNLCPMILEFIYHMNDISTRTVRFIEDDVIRHYLSNVAFHELILIVYIITEICYCEDDKLNLELNNDTSDNSAASSGEDDYNDKATREICKTLSHYMMYLLISCRSLLPVVVSDTELKRVMNSLKLFPITNIGKLMEEIEKNEHTFKREVGGGRKWILNNVQDLPYAVAALIDYFFTEHKEDKWDFLKTMWLLMLCYAAINGQKNHHLQQLREGGEFLTLLWFLIPQSNIFDGVDTFNVNLYLIRHFQLAQEEDEVSS